MLKKIFFYSLFISILEANVNVACSIPPIESFIKSIAKDKVDVLTIVKPGHSPHTYEPKPSQMVKISKAKIYFAIGVEFEKVWLKKFRNQNKNLKIIHLDKNIKKIPIGSNHTNHHLDPHIWTSTKNIKQISKYILDSLIKADSINKKFYIDNYNTFIKQISKLENNIKNILQKSSNKSFIVFHPSWGYFAKEYNLKQISIEIDGKTPKPKEIIKIIKIAKKYNIHSIVTSPEFSNKVAKQLANQLQIDVVKLSPLSTNLEKTLIDLANSIIK